MLHLWLACFHPGGSPEPEPAAGTDPVAAPSGTPAVPWQPHGLRHPTVRCTFEVPAAWTRSASPMPDHIAELSSAGMAPAMLIVEERVESDLPSAHAHVLAYYQSGLLTADGARVVTDVALTGATAGRLLSIRWGPPDAGRIETVVLLAFPGLPLVGMVARHPESDQEATEAITTVVQSTRCSLP